MNTHVTVSSPVARLALADGSVYVGSPFGARGRGVESVGEVVFNTAMCGYQESLTDPSYSGQILVQTFPMIGNYGVNSEDVESRGVQVAGFVVRELAATHSNYRASESLDAYLARHGVLGITGIDTRALTRRLRGGGAMAGVLTDRQDRTDAELVEAARRAPSMAGQNLVPRVGCTSGRTWSQTLGDWAPAATPAASAFGRGSSEPGKGSFRVLTLDCGAKANILRNLASRGCEVLVVPHDTPAAEIVRKYRAGEIDGVFISNGPGDPAAVEATIATLRDLLHEPAAQAVPMFGICLGHQLLALAAGGTTYKLKFGHRGANQPILNTRSGRVEITSQNHGFAVDTRSIEAAGGEVTHVHLNDQTLAGFRLKDRPVFSVQYHPEASPGPHDSGYLFDEFVRSMAERRAGKPVRL
ncbi:MAG: glutamine-hydrolyzing carbamoyl-phosphate synthase small subunit [Planctomycetota bacterium]|nr:glutamine-hydrolyzing carbamoyl-phosphate synthase small subunit [Planctomycetota bacterium]